MASALTTNLTNAVALRIQERTWNRVRHLRVDLDNERLVVRGTAASYYLKQLALHAAAELCGPERQLHLNIEIG